MRPQRPNPLKLVDHLPQPPLSSSHTASAMLCTTIFEEDSDTEVDAPPTPSAFKRQSNGMSIRPRALRLNSLGDDSDPEDLTVLRFPTPPSLLPITRPLSTPPQRPSRRPPPLRTITVPQITPRLKSVFEDDSPSDYAFPRTVPIPSKISPTAPLSFVKRATNAIRSSSPSKSMLASTVKPTTSSSPLNSAPVAPHSPEKPLPHFASTLESESGNISPTPSLSSSASSSSSSSIHTSFLPILSPTHPYARAPSPSATSAKDVDDYVEALSSYFPNDAWSWDEVEVNRSHSSRRKDRTRSSSSSSTGSNSSTHLRVSSDEGHGPRPGEKQSLRGSASSSELRSKAIKANASIRSGSPSPQYLPLSFSGSSSSSSSTCSSPTPTPSRSSSSPIPSNSYSRSHSPTHPVPISPGHRSPTFQPKSILKSSKSSPALKPNTPMSPPPVPYIHVAHAPTAMPSLPVMQRSSSHSHRPRGATSSTSSQDAPVGRKSLPQRPPIPVEMFLKAV